MKKQLTILLLCTLLLAPLSLAQSIPKTHPNATASTSVDVPVWSVGNTWTYRINDLSVDINETDFMLSIHAAVTNLTLVVDNETPDAYIVHIKPTTITGDYAVYADFGDGPINITGDLKEITLEGILQVSKASLGMKSINLTINGKMTIEVHDQPYFEPLSRTYTFSAVIDSQFVFDAPYGLIAFPLEVGANWGIPANNVTLSGTIDSPWFRFVNFINRIVRGFHLIGPIANILNTSKENLQNVSDILDDILPTVDIAHVMNTYLNGNTIAIPEIPPVLICNNTELLTVPAGTYTVYNITTVAGGGRVYYAPDAGYYVRMKGSFNESLPFLKGVDMELLATNFQP